LAKLWSPDASSENHELMPEGEVLKGKLGTITEEGTQKGEENT
jgi:hypothetical protein